MSTWVIPYIDQEPSFWEMLGDRFGTYIKEVYFPMPSKDIASGRSGQPDNHIESFLRDAPLAKSALINSIILPRPIQEIGPKILDSLRHLYDEYGVERVVVTHPLLARLIKAELPVYQVTASVLMGIATPAQVNMIRDDVDAIVAAGHLTRDLKGLRTLREAFRGDLRLIVNEACLPNCVYRSQHFYEMGYGEFFPESLCQELLTEKPWLRMTGAWILPRHLHFYDGICDSFKLAGRITLQNPEIYVKVLNAYVTGGAILPCDIGGGPASVLEPIDVPDELFAYILNCDKQCHVCRVCQNYYEQAVSKG